MKKKFVVAALASLMLAAGYSPALAKDCDTLIKEAEERLATTEDRDVHNDVRVILVLAEQLRWDREPGACEPIAQLAIDRFNAMMAKKPVKQ